MSNSDNKEINNQRQKDWRKNNPERAKAIWKTYRNKRKKDPKRNKKWYQYLSDYNQKIRQKLFDILGGEECQCDGINCWHEDKCGLTDRRILNFDHKNPKSHKERRKKGQYSEWLYYSQRPDEAKKELQVRCCNCNWVKMYDCNETRKPKF